MEVELVDGMGSDLSVVNAARVSFAKRKEDKGSEWLEPAEVVERAQQAWDRGGTEVCIQGGLHPKMEGNYYRKLVLAIKAALPDMHIHAFSPFEVWYGAVKSKLSYRDFLSDLKDCGLGSMPGTAAEILDTEVRQKLTKNKLSADCWEEIIRTAHDVGIPSTATIMYGHVDEPKHWAAHIALLREIQKDTGGFTELVPLSFVHTDSPLFLNNPDSVRPGPTDHEVDLMHSVSRIMLNGFIDNIQVSWTKLGAERARNMLSLGVMLPDIQPKATDYINEIIIMIEKLIKNKCAYLDNNHVMFDVESYKHYGKLSRRSIEDQIEGARVETVSYTHRRCRRRLRCRSRWSPYH